MNETELASRVDIKNKDKCWPWLGATVKGYGCYRELGKNYYAHRLSFELFNGIKLTSDIKVLHRCNNPICVNPHHLFAGTKADNVEDMDIKGRRISLYGEENPRSKLTLEQVKEIKQLLRHSLAQRTIAERYNIKHSTVGQIARGVTWKDA